MKLLKDCTGPCPATIPITTWRNSWTKTDGRTENIDIPIFVSKLRYEGQIVKPKMASEGFNATMVAGGLREDASVLSIHALLLDCDQGVSWSALKTHLIDAGLCSVFYETSGSSDPDNFKWRVIIPLTESHVAQGWSQKYLAAMHYFERLVQVKFDSACQNPSRIFYFGYRQTEQALPRQVLFQSGKALDLNKLVSENIDVPRVAEQWNKLEKVSRGKFRMLKNYFARRGWLGDQHGNKWYVICPNNSKHTNPIPDGGNPDSSTCIQSQGEWLFKCLHGHCQELTHQDILDKIREDIFEMLDSRFACFRTREGIMLTYEIDERNVAQLLVCDDLLHRFVQEQFTNLQVENRTKQ